MRRMVLSLGLLGVSALPISSDTNCGIAYIRFAERLEVQQTAMGGEKLAHFHRAALRIFDACDSGHVENANGKFDRLLPNLAAQP